MEFFENDLEMELTLSGTTGSVLRPPDVAFVGFNDLEPFYTQSYVDTEQNPIVKSTDEDDLWSELFGGGNGPDSQQPNGSPPLWLSEGADPSALDAILSAGDPPDSILDAVVDMTMVDLAPMVDTPVILSQIRTECERFTPDSLDSQFASQPVILVCTPVPLPQNQTNLPPGTLAYKLVRETVPPKHFDHTHTRTVQRKKKSGDRKERKKDQNRQAAYRYRLKKKMDKGQKEMELSRFEERNRELRSMMEEKMREIGMLKGLLAEFLERKKAE